MGTGAAVSAGYCGEVISRVGSKQVVVSVGLLLVVLLVAGVIVSAL